MPTYLATARCYGVLHRQEEEEEDEHGVARPALASSAFVYTSDVAILESCGLWSRPLAPSDGRYMCVVRVVRAPACLRWVDADGWHWHWLAAAPAPKRCIVAVSHGHAGSPLHSTPTHGIDDAGHV